MKPKPGTCGASGGLTRAGKPCGRPTKEGRCPDHQVKALRTVEQAKKRTLELLGPTSDYSLEEIGLAVGFSRTTIWEWTQEDDEFGEAYRAALQAREEHLGKVRAAKLADAAYRRSLEGKSSAAETIFLMTNYDSKKWKDRRAIGGDPEAPPVRFTLDVSGGQTFDPDDQDDRPPGDRKRLPAGD